MPVDIEYPFPCDRVGNSFHAGGTYDASRRTTKIPWFYVIASGKIICKVMKGKTTLDTKEFDLTGMPEQGPWNVPFSTTGDHEDCHITAELHVGSAPFPTDQVDEIDIFGAANVDIGIS